MKIRRFNEDITDGSIEQGSNIFQTSIFTDIEGDLENMQPGEAEDYLLSIIAFCNQQIQNNKVFFNGSDENI